MPILIAPEPLCVDCELDDPDEPQPEAAKANEARTATRASRRTVINTSRTRIETINRLDESSTLTPGVMASLSAERRTAVKRWTIAAVVVATVLFVLANRDDVYILTSPPELSWHILLRKVYSVIAFALVGYLIRRALVENGRPQVTGACIAVVAAYSALIEVAQFIGGSQEGVGWNVFDVFCGALGGAIAVSDRLFPALRLKR